jgi:hypothetical protein
MGLWPILEDSIKALGVFVAALAVVAPPQAEAEDGTWRRVKLADSVDFPVEVLRPNSRGPYTHRAVTSSLRHARGHVVELLYDAVEGAQIRDPVSQRMVWVAKTKIAVLPPEAAVSPHTDFQPYDLVTARPIRFPLRKHDGKLVGDTTVPAGEQMRVTAAEAPYLRLETRDLIGWVKSNDLEQKTERALTALAGLPDPSATRPDEEASLEHTSETRATPTLTPFQTSESHSYIELVPLIITAEVLGRQKYPMPGQKAGFWSTEVSPMDLALAWGPFVKAGAIRAQMGYRQASFQFRDSLARIYSGNFHMYVDDPEVRKKLVNLQVGDVVRLKGALIRLEHPRGKANPAESTITGAYCYTMLCREVEKMPEIAAAAD